MVRVQGSDASKSRSGEIQIALLILGNNDYHCLDIQEKRVAMAAALIRETFNTTWRGTAVRAYVQMTLVELR